MGSISRSTMNDFSAKASYCILLYIFAQVGLFLMAIEFLISFRFFWKMSMESSTFIGFTNGAIRHTQHSASAAWVIYTPMGQVLFLGVVCLWPSSNSVGEYSALIELLWDAILHRVLSLEVRLDSELVVSQLNGLYHVIDLTLLRRFLQVRLLKQIFFQYNMHTYSKN